MTRNDGPGVRRDLDRDTESIAGATMGTTWVVRFESEGLEPSEVRMIQELIEGNLGIARLLFGPTHSGGVAGRQIADRVRDALTVDFPNVAFRVEPID